MATVLRGSAPSAPGKEKLRGQLCLGLSQAFRSAERSRLCGRNACSRRTVPASPLTVGHVGECGGGGGGPWRRARAPVPVVRRFGQLCCLVWPHAVQNARHCAPAPGRDRPGATCAFRGATSVFVRKDLEKHTGAPHDRSSREEESQHQKVEQHEATLRCPFPPLRVGGRVEPKMATVLRGSAPSAPGKEKLRGQR